MDNKLKREINRLSDEISVRNIINKFYKDKSDKEFIELDKFIVNTKELMKNSEYMREKIEKCYETINKLEKENKLLKENYYCQEEVEENYENFLRITDFI